MQNSNRCSYFFIPKKKGVSAIMQHPLNPTWDLESIFPGGSDSEALQQSFAAIEQDLALLNGELKELSSPISEDSIPALAKITTRLQDLNRRMQEAGAFISCLTAQNLQDKKAVQLTGRKSALSAQLVAIDALYDELLRGMPDERWSRFLALPEIEGWLSI